MGDCDFCRIAAGEKEARLLYTDDDAVAFLDEAPATRGHALVVPTRHVEDLLLAPEGVSTPVWRAAHRVATGLEAVLDCDGFSTVHTAGGLVGSMEHAHVHVLPRTLDDDIHIALEREGLTDPEPFAAAVRGAIDEAVAEEA